MSEVEEIARRCEEATGPDRRLDAEVDWTIRGEIGAWYVSHGPGSLFSEVPGWWRDAADRSHKAPEFTTSLDAAMTIAPDGWRLRQMNFSGPCADDRKWHLNLYGGPVGEDCFVGRGATPALALCAAALRARQHLLSQQARP